MLPETTSFPFSCQQAGQTNETLVFLVKLSTISNPLPFSLYFLYFKLICPYRETLRGTSSINSQDNMCPESEPSRAQDTSPF